MVDKTTPRVQDAVARIPDGASVMISGFGEAGSPIELIHALIDQGAKDLTVISNNAGNGHVGLAALIEARRVRRILCSFPKSSNSTVFTELYHRGEIELELIPQGTLAARIQAGGSGIPAFYTPTAVGTVLAEGKEVRAFQGKRAVLELALTADFALVSANVADRYGNLTYRYSARNFGPLMCMAARHTIVQARRVVEPGGIDPETVVTPGIFVQEVVEIPDPACESRLIAKGMRYP